MAIHNTIHLGGNVERVSDYTAFHTITPGMHIRLRPDGKWEKDNAALTEQYEVTIALETLRGITVDYVAGDFVIAGKYGPGGKFLGMVQTGQDIQFGELLSPNGGGTGTWKTAGATTAAANIARVRSLQTLGVVAEVTRCEMDVF
jgi:hypothetical protein